MNYEFSNAHLLDSEDYSEALGGFPAKPRTTLAAASKPAFRTASTSKPVASTTAKPFASTASKPVASIAPKPIGTSGLLITKPAISTGLLPRPRPLPVTSPTQQVIVAQPLAASVPLSAVASETSGGGASGGGGAAGGGGGGEEKSGEETQAVAEEKKYFGMKKKTAVIVLVGLIALGGYLYYKKYVKA